MVVDPPIQMLHLTCNPRPKENYGILFSFKIVVKVENLCVLDKYRQIGS